jgi:hypothetical protein
MIPKFLKKISCGIFFLLVLYICIELSLAFLLKLKALPIMAALLVAFYLV